jgi:hypothetical protein
MFLVTITVFIAETSILPGLSRFPDTRRVRKRKETVHQFLPGGSWLGITKLKNFYTLSA